MPVYAIEAVGLNVVKIGFSNSPKERLYNLQCASPVDLVLRGLSERERESDLHRRFADHRVRGEWFKMVDEVVAWIDSLRGTFSCGRCNLPATWDGIETCRRVGGRCLNGRKDER